MSDMYQKPIFSPVINITKSRDKPVFVSELDLKKEKRDIFFEAEEIRRAMAEHELTLMQTAEMFGRDGRYIANKLRILELSDDERKIALLNGFNEKEILAFLQLNKNLRLKTISECGKENIRGKKLEEYIENLIEREKNKKSFSARVSDVGFLANSLNKILNLAKKMGFDATVERTEDDESFIFNICVKKKNSLNYR